MQLRTASSAAPSNSSRLLGLKSPSFFIVSFISRNRMAACASGVMHCAYVVRGRISTSVAKGFVLGKMYSGNSAALEGVMVVMRMSCGAAVSINSAVVDLGSARSA